MFRANLTRFYLEAINRVLTGDDEDKKSDKCKGDEEESDEKGNDVESDEKKTKGQESGDEKKEEGEPSEQEQREGDEEKVNDKNREKEGKELDNEEEEMIKGDKDKDKNGKKEEVKDKVNGGGEDTNRPPRRMASTPKAAPKKAVEIRGKTVTLDQRKTQRDVDAQAGISLEVGDLCRELDQESFDHPYFNQGTLFTFY